MAITHSVTIRNLMADTALGLIDAGTTNSEGQLVLYVSPSTEVATLIASSPPAFAPATGGTATANPIASDTNATGGTPNIFKFEDRDENEVFSGTVTVTGGGGDLQLSAALVPPGGTVSVSAFDYNAPV